MGLPAWAMCFEAMLCYDCMCGNRVEIVLLELRWTSNSDRAIECGDTNVTCTSIEAEVEIEYTTYKYMYRLDLDE
jgi:hypothetical protein